MEPFTRIFRSFLLLVVAAQGVSVLKAICFAILSIFVFSDVFAARRPFPIQNRKSFEGPIRITLERNEERDSARLFLPKSLKESDRVPLVVLLHGYGSSGRLHDLLFRFKPFIKNRQFALLIPEGTLNKKEDKKFWNGTDACCDFEPTGVDDVGYLDQLIREVVSRGKVASDRVYLVGHSNGGFMSYRMACEGKYPIAGAAILNGVTFKNPDDCKPPKSVNILHIHSTEDPSIPFDGKDNMPSAEQTVRQWVDFNKCDVVKFESKANLLPFVSGAETEIYRSNQCADGSKVHFWRMNEADHTPFPGKKFRTGILDFFGI